MLAPRGVELGEDELLELYARHEAELEAGPYLHLPRGARRVAPRRLRPASASSVSDEETAAFAAAVGDWPAFPDTAAALRHLHERFRLGVITNCDRDLFARSNRRLGVTFDWVVTAEDAGAYKPSLAPFELAFATLDVPRERILHVAQSLFHDHVPAKELGLTTVWVDRRHDREGFGATPEAVAEPDLIVPDMVSLAAAGRRRGSSDKHLERLAGEIQHGLDQPARGEHVLARELACRPCAPGGDRPEDRAVLQLVPRVELVELGPGAPDALADERPARGLRDALDVAAARRRGR